MAAGAPWWPPRTAPTVPGARRRPRRPMPGAKFQNRFQIKILSQEASCPFIILLGRRLAAGGRCIAALAARPGRGAAHAHGARMQRNRLAL